MRDFNLDFEKAYAISHSIFNKVVKKSTTEQEDHSALINMPKMATEKENVVAREYNTKAFVHKFGRPPVNEQEVREWVTSIMREIDENELKEPPPLQ